MAAKYRCEKCERRFVDWGAKKIGFTCPDCDEKLVVIGLDRSTTTSKKKPSLRRVATEKVDGPKTVTSLDGESEEAVPAKADALGVAAVSDDDVDDAGPDLSTDEESV